MPGPKYGDFTFPRDFGFTGSSGEVREIKSYVRRAAKAKRVPGEGPMSDREAKALEVTLRRPVARGPLLPNKRPPVKKAMGGPVTAKGGGKVTRAQAGEIAEQKVDAKMSMHLHSKPPAGHGVKS